MNSLVDKWEGARDQFKRLPKAEFDQLCCDKRFADGPTVSKPSAWMREFGPHGPHRWAFGRLDDDRLVCCDVAAEGST